MALKDLKKELKSVANREHAAILQRFFKTGKGQYGEGDLFMGIKIPLLRSITTKHLGLTFEELHELITSKYHEERMSALMHLVLSYKKAMKKNDHEFKKQMVDFYLAHTKYINNWDLVDLSAQYILGEYFLDKEKTVLYSLVESNDLWEKRIAVISTFYFIKNRKYDDALFFIEKLMFDKHDLIQKATGWMLREIGNRDMEVEEEFLKLHYKVMPRTMLRYAIEKFPEDKRLFYLNKKVKVNK